MIHTCTTEHCIGASTGTFYIEAKSNSAGQLSCQWVEWRNRLWYTLDTDPFGRIWFRNTPVTIKDSLK